MFAGVINAVRDTETDIHLVVHGKGVNNENRPSMRPIAYSSGSPWIVVEMRAKFSNRVREKDRDVSAFEKYLRKSIRACR